MASGTTVLRAVLSATFLAAAAVIAVMLLGGHSMAADASRGQLLYENHCTVCHTSVVHVRDRRKAGTRPEIQAWILRWQEHLGLNWGAQEIDDVAEFLNQRYYHLEDDS